MSDRRRFPVHLLPAFLRPLLLATALLGLSPDPTLHAAPAAAAEGKDKAEAPKPERKTAPPQLLLVLPLAGQAGLTNHLRFRGLELTNVTGIWLHSSPPPASNGLFAATGGLRALLRSTAKAEAPKELDAKKVGDTMVEADILLPSSTLPATNWIVLVNPDGSSPARPWPVLPAGKLREEKEPNGSFKAAQPLEPGATVQGSIKESGDVDVFRWTARRGTTYRIAVSAAGLGSPLDGAVTVTDSRGHQQAVQDDTASSSDPTLLWKAPADGDYFLTVMDALDKGSALHVYLLQLTVEAE